MGYAGRTKYDRPGKAAEYRDRSAHRDAEEWRLVRDVIDALPRPPATAWDLPCGTGRIAERLIELGIRTWCGDLSPAMRSQTDARLAGRELFAGVTAFDLEDPGSGSSQTADLVVCLRFLHHLPDRDHRVRVLATLRGLCDGHVLLSFHHPVSFHNLRRGLRRLLTGTRGDRHTLFPGALREEAAEAGLELLHVRALAAYRREFWLALLRPNDVGPILVGPAELAPQPSG